MIKQKTIVTLLLIAVLTLYIWWAEPCNLFCKKQAENRIESSEYQRQIEMLQHKNKFLHQLNRQLDSAVMQLNHQADSLKTLANADQHTIIQLKKRQHEKIKRINHFSNTELVQFFTNLDHAANSTATP